MRSAASPETSRRAFRARLQSIERLTTIRCSHGAERPPPVEAVERADRRDERLLGDVLGGRAVVDDQVRGAVGAAPVAPEQLLERLLGAPLRLP